MKMTEGFPEKTPIQMEGFDFQAQPLMHYPTTYPTWPEQIPLQANWPAPGCFAELEFTGWRDEGIAKHETVSISNYLSPALPVIVVSGPDALRFFEDHLVNGFKKFPIGRAKQAIMCDDNGNMIMQGILYRLGEEKFETQCLMTLPYIIARDGAGYDMKVEDVTQQRFMMQTSGKNTLPLFEELCQCDLHDLKYCYLTNAEVDGRPVRIYRFGMTGSIGYEISGNVEDANYVYKRILEVGQKYGIRRMGARAYTLNHTPGGFLQYGMHYLNSIMDDPGFQEAMKQQNAISGLALPIRGSFDGDHTELFANPIEYGCGNVVKFNHEFPGKAALEEIAAHPRKKMVTLEWNADDLADIYRSQFADREPYMPMDLPDDSFECGQQALHADWVVDGQGNHIGISTQRTLDAFYRQMLSLCAIDIDYAEEGTEVGIVWGMPGYQQKVVRAKVARFPYNEHLSNRTFDLESIPRPGYPAPEPRDEYL
jgi:vanillate/3-O-methylgallate O-demethylase